jgi:hypothetical protein
MFPRPHHPPQEPSPASLAMTHTTAEPPAARPVARDPLEEGGVPLNPWYNPNAIGQRLEAISAAAEGRADPLREQFEQQQQQNTLRRHAAALSGTPPQLIQQNLQAATPTTIQTGPVTTRPRSPVGRRPQRERGNKRRRVLKRRGAAQVPTVRHADHDERITDTQQGVRNWHRNNGAAGTYNAYSPKKLEWDDYCAAVYGQSKCAAYKVDSIAQLPTHELGALFTVTPNKAYGFVFYHAHRSKVNGGKASGEARKKEGKPQAKPARKSKASGEARKRKDAEQEGFNVADYNEGEYCLNFSPHRTLNFSPHRPLIPPHPTVV